MKKHRDSIAEAKNLGPKSVLLLQEIGIDSLEQLSELGAVASYKLLLAANGKVSRNMLYAMYGAIHNIHWAELPQAVKDDLIAAIQDPVTPFR